MRSDTVIERLNALRDEAYAEFSARLIPSVARERISEFYGKIQMFLYDPSPIVRETALYALNELHIKIQETDAGYLLNDTDRFLGRYAATVLKNV